MSQRVEVLEPGAAGRSASGAGRAEERPHPSGGLDGLLGTAPVFSGAVRGYDRLQVDNYVAWAESEIALARRESDHLLSRYAACSAELQVARRRLAQLARERDSAPTTERAHQVLLQAADQAAALTAAAEAEAARICAQARAEAEVRLQNVAGLREAAVAAREDAAETLEAARRERAAAEEAAAARLTAMQAEMDGLRRERDQARGVLRRLTDEVDRALGLLAPDPARELRDAPPEVRPESPSAGRIGTCAVRTGDRLPVAS